MQHRTPFATRAPRAARTALFAALAASLGATLGVAGCAGDEYRCTPSGCFYCDGVACRPATPPDRALCRRDADCPATAYCTAVGCVARCARDTDCSPGWACRGAGDSGALTAGRCLSPSEAEPVAMPGGCTSSAECGARMACVNGACQTTAMPACTADAQCAGGTLCVAGRCTAAQDTCRFDTQCGTGRACVNNQCLARCDGATACPAGQTCATAGTVRYCSAPATPAGPACARDMDCGAGRRCVDSACFTGCTPSTASTACGAEQYCTDEGVCRADTRPRPFCDATHPCGPGSDCVGGVCRVPCATSVECQRVDITFRNCGRVPYLTVATTYCLTDNEARPNCTRQSECMAGQVCADSVCR